MGKQKKAYAILPAALLSAALFLGGCAGDATAEDDNLILLVETEEDTTVTGVAVATRTDVSKTLKILLEYKATKSEDLAFALDSREVAEVLVEEGDYVQKGDVLAKLTTKDDTSEEEGMVYTISRLELELEQVQNEKAMDIREEEFQYAVGNHDKDTYEYRIKAIESDYASRIQS
jgi:multidrug efflux pump subunit AcrA (membrane-fusion protein)